EARRGVDDVGLDAGLVREGLQQRINELRLAVGVDVDLALSERGACCPCNHCDREDKLGERARRPVRQKRDVHSDLHTSELEAGIGPRATAVPPRRGALVRILIEIVKKGKSSTRLELF